MPVSKSDYKKKLFNQIPLYTTRLEQNYDASYEVREQVKCPTDVADLLKEFFADKHQEHLVVLFLDTANKVTGMSVVHVGTINSAPIEPRDIFRPAILANASAVIVAHNHPSGNPEPSRADIRETRNLKEAGETMRIPVHDHLIIAEGESTSLAERGIL